MQQTRIGVVQSKLPFAQIEPALTAVGQDQAARLVGPVVVLETHGVLLDGAVPLAFFEKAVASLFART